MAADVQIQRDLAVKASPTNHTLMLDVLRPMLNQLFVRGELLVAHHARRVQHLLPGDHAFFAVLQFHVALNRHTIHVRIVAQRTLGSVALVRRQLGQRLGLHWPQPIRLLHARIRLVIAGRKRVHFAVAIEGGARRECVSTDLANERPFAGVLAFVLDHHAVPVERARTVATLELVLFAVVAHVLGHSFEIGLAANVAS